MEIAWAMQECVCVCSVDLGGGGGHSLNKLLQAK